MSKKTIVLADNSYTIRRIVELSFSEEKDIELVSFENSLNLREKLLELRPHVVLVDIKLPEFNGYDVCKFVQETEDLKHTRVFLLKGGFEPVDENRLKNLRYVDIITKPFDSNALVSNIKKLLEGVTDTPQEAPSASTPPLPPVPPSKPGEMPSSLPEDFPEIDAVPEPGAEINFSDVKEEIESAEGIPGDELTQTPGTYSDDDILPSEEITRAQPEKDTISPNAEEMEENPFKEEVPAAQAAQGTKQGTDSLTEEELDIKKNIEMQEKELEMGSLTVEEMNIQQDIESRRRTRKIEALEADIREDVSGEDISAMFPPPTPDSPPAVLTEEPIPPADSPQESEKEPAGIDSELFSFGEQKAEEIQPPEILQEPETQEIKFSAEVDKLDFEKVTKAEPETLETFTTEKFAMPDLEPPLPVKEIPDLEAIKVDEEMEPEVEPTEYQDVKEYEVPPLDTPPTPGEEETPVPIKAEPAAAAPLPLEFDQIPKAPPPPKLDQIPEPPPIPKIEETTPPPIPEQEVETPGIPHEHLLPQVEDKLTHAIKEMLWEIVPPLAEKIIKKEIESLKNEVEGSFK